MTMKSVGWVGLASLFLIAGLGLGVGSASTLAADGAPGADLFAANQCAMCHSVASAGIEAKVKSEKMRGPDLSGYVDSREAGVLGGFLRKEADLDGTSHKKAFAGTPEELASILAWLGQLEPAK